MDLTPDSTAEQRMSRPCARRRQGVKNLAAAYDLLRAHIPTYPPGKKLTKIETLRLSMLYIQDLRELLGEAQRGSVVVGADNALKGQRKDILRRKMITSADRSASLGTLPTAGNAASPIPSEALSDEPVRSRWPCASPGREAEDLEDLLAFSRSAEYNWTEGSQHAPVSLQSASSQFVLQKFNDHSSKELSSLSLPSLSGISPSGLLTDGLSLHNAQDHVARSSSTQFQSELEYTNPVISAHPHLRVEANEYLQALPMSTSRRLVSSWQ